MTGQKTWPSSSGLDIIKTINNCDSYKIPLAFSYLPITMYIADSFIEDSGSMVYWHGQVKSLAKYVSCDTLHWRHNGRDGVSNHQPRDCLLNRLFGCRSKKTSKLCATGLCAGNSPGTGEFSAQRANNAENVSIWWRHHETISSVITTYNFSKTPLLVWNSLTLVVKYDTYASPDIVDTAQLFLKVFF